ncbi:MAG: ABC transporter ATP-binding protein, partial [Pirellulaceae bacterium]|nr:ABC transporter ATP-binding protein [Pirellulaceae bacterium]
DEPTGNLDRTNGRLVGELLVEMQRQESAILIVVTHSSQLAEMMTRRCELDEGRLREENQ